MGLLFVVQAQTMRLALVRSTGNSAKLFMVTEDSTRCKYQGGCIEKSTLRPTLEGDVVIGTRSCLA